MTTNGDGREAGRGAGRGSAPTTGMRIGEFAGLTGLSVRALRWYDAEGVLVPRVDPASGHRRYLLTQLDHAVLIRTLRDAGVPLPEIRAVLTGDPDATPGAEDLLSGPGDMFFRTFRSVLCPSDREAYNFQVPYFSARSHRIPAAFFVYRAPKPPGAAQLAHLLACLRTAISLMK